MAIRNDITIDWNVSPRIITIDAPSTEVSMQDLYDTLRDREPIQMDEPGIVSGAGKEELGGGVLVGLTITLLNALLAFEGRPGPAFELCNVSGGNLVALDSNGNSVSSPISPTSYVQVILANSSSATLIDSAISDSLDYNGMLMYDVNNVDGVGQTHPVGTNANPVNNITDGIAIAIKYNLHKVGAFSDIHSDRDLEKFSIIGLMPNLTFFPNGFKAHLFKFDDIKINGDFNNSLIKVKGCNILEALNVYGVIDDSYHSGRILISANQNLNMDNSQSGIPGLESPEVDMNQGVDTTLSLRAFSGGQKITNCDTLNSVATISFQDGGKPHLEPSCTSGLISVRGVGYLDDRSNGSTIETSAWINAIDITELHKLQGLNKDFPMTVTPTQRAVDDIDLTISGDGENVSVVTRQ